MPLRIVEPPLAARESLRRALDAIVERSPGTGDLELGDLHGIYGLTVAELDAGLALDTARLLGWRCLARLRGQVVASAEVDADDTGLAHVDQGPLARSTAGSIEEMRARPEVEQGSFEIRLLRIPALYLVALWLKDLGGPGDLFEPLSPVGSTLEEGRLYSTDELTALIRRPVAAVIPSAGAAEAGSPAHTG